MECNRDEALQVLVLAEVKFMEKDYMGAKKLALKAQNLFPSLEEISQMITILDIYLASEAKVNGEKDWYSILLVDASADEEMLKCQYRKLALMLHPDKNKSAGAEGAFQLVSQAWSVLSDKNHRMLYDQKMSEKNSHQRTTYPGVDNNGFYQLINNSSTRTKVKQRKSKKTPSSQPFQTFWTSCVGCRMQYEFHRVYLNKSLLCPKCKQAFLALELPSPPSRINNPPQWIPKKQNRNTKSKNAKNNVFTPMADPRSHNGLNTESLSNHNIHCSPFSGAGATANANGLSTNTMHTTKSVHHAYKEKRKCEEVQATIRKEEALRRKLMRRTLGGNQNTEIVADKYAAKTGTGDDSRNNIISDPAVSNVCSRNTIPEGDYYKSKLSPRSINFSRGYTHVDARAILIERAKDGILKKLRELYFVEATKVNDNDRMMKKQKYKDGKVKGDSADMLINGFSRSNSKVVTDKKHLQFNGIDDSCKQVNHHLSIDVPDSDFHDFDSDRTEKAFSADQVWATYDDDDGMPRYYALIQKVLSVKPFKARISFLTSKSNVEFGKLDWVSSGFPKTCGDFRVGRYVVANKINIFSHRVKWEKGFRGVIKVLPRKGDIWALYRNWHPNWTETTTDDMIHKYDMVEVLEDYNEDRGISVVPLVKVAGFKTVFLKHMDPNENKRIPKEEMFRFSHQVPSYLLTGEEAYNAPKDCIELDPAATSLELLQVLTETKDANLMNGESIESVDHGVPCPVSGLLSVIAV